MEYYSNGMVFSNNYGEGDYMLSDKEYIRHSIETNLFFIRIVKEHAIFAAASLPPKNRAVTNNLITIKNSFERLLGEAIELADRVVSHEVLASDELVTDYTLEAEMKTQSLTGIHINTDLTRRELELRAGNKGRNDCEFVDDVTALNRKALKMTKAAADFKKRLLNSILECKTFSYIYPSMLHHIIEESEYYIMLLEKLERRDGIDSIKEIIEAEINWNHIMGEHSEYIRGYLDPEEEELFNTANAFSKEFERLLEKTEQTADNRELLPKVTRESIKDVTSLRNFKKQGTQGILNCEIKSVIPPLLADHVLREANHYLRLLRMFEKMI